MGIIKGRSGIPAEWIEPIGEQIKTVAINPFRVHPPDTLAELTDRVIHCKEQLDLVNPTVLRLTDGETVLDNELLERLGSGALLAEQSRKKSSRTMTIALSYGNLFITFEKSPVMAPGETQEITLAFAECRHENSVVQVEWQLPESWQFEEGSVHQMMGYYDNLRYLKVHLTAGEFLNALEYIPIKITVSNRNYPEFRVVPFQREGAVVAHNKGQYPPYWPFHDRIQRSHVASNC